jgi:hypothetical protein
MFTGIPLQSVDRAIAIVDYFLESETNGTRLLLLSPAEWGATTTFIKTSKKGTKHYEV